MKEFPINEQINDKELRVIDENGQMLGIMSAYEARQLAESKDLDLVKVAPDAKPPVCRILDYGKYRYEQNKREKESKKNQASNEIKEMRTSCRVQDHDLEVKVKNVQKFLSEGNRVKISVRFRGREMTYIESGRELLMRIKDMLGDTCVIDKEPKIEGRNYTMFVAPAANIK
ncbi:MAG: translation initiation factor IF-3 [Eubacteriaceae bacterium]|nr:translation initiation factor IF-3 [Lachnospiraceae bacterium]MBR4395218.1 translation initiation factor IF-3 [Eubacteriaceae bacterium]MBR5995171.1 translation initiation factor IF-3 [Eubacteriaceae bacterium]